MKNIELFRNEFKKNGGVLKTSELNMLGYYNRQIQSLVNEGTLSNIKHGFYELTDYMPREEVIIARLFPQAVIFLESALLFYEYTDRIPPAWQIAVDRNSKKTKYKIDYPVIEPFYQHQKYLNIGSDIIVIDGVDVKIFDRDRTICDVFRYENKMEKEIVKSSIQRYLDDRQKNIRKLMEYAKLLNIKNKVQKYMGMWL